MENVWYLWEDRCEGCEICIEVCPTKALSKSKGLSSKGFFTPILDREKCTYCAICDMQCPDLAIVVVRAKQPKEVTVS